MSSFRFTRAERLKSKLQFNELARKGKSLKEGPLRLRFLPAQEQSVPVKVAFSVPKRLVNKAVDRNRIKRQMRDVYRLLKPQLYARLSGRSIKASFLFVYLRNEKIATDRLRDIMQRLLERWLEEQVNEDANG